MKTVALEWGAFMRGEVVEKRIKPEAVVEKPNIIPALTSAALTTGILALKIAAAAHVVSAAPVAIPAMAVASAAVSMATGTPDFSAQLSAATRPIKDIIFGFAGEIYFVFMAWGALEALIGKPAQGFSRMKIATGAYILLYWVPWIVDQVNKVRPGF